MKNITINVAMSYAMLLTSYLILGNQMTDCRDQTNPTYSQFNTFCINKVCFPSILMTQHTVIRYQKITNISYNWEGGSRKKSCIMYKQHVIQTPPHQYQHGEFVQHVTMQSSTRKAQKMLVQTYSTKTL